jgi:enoyl-CoA hydratase/carnithine racemase
MTGESIPALGTVPVVEYTEITYDVSDRIATITLHRPDKLNAFTRTMMIEMIDAFDRVDVDDDVRAVIVTGSGRAYCAGADLGSGGDTFARKRGSGSDVGSEERSVPRDGGGMLTLRIFDCTKPVIGAINGAAVGIGATMTLPMDIRLASTGARFGFVFTRRGIVPEACSSWFLPRLVGISAAAEWCYSGRLFPASEACERGLVRSVHEPDDLLAEARRIATEIADHTAPVSVALTRQMLWRMLGADHPMEAHRVDSRGIMERGNSADAREGVESFLEKRDPVYPVKVSDGLPDIFPDYQEPSFH